MHTQAAELDHAIEAIRVCFGSQALTRAGELPPPAAWPSGAPLDGLTGIGGVPFGGLTLLVRDATCGELPLALRLRVRVRHEHPHARAIAPAYGVRPRR